MARIVGAFGVSHGPLLTTPPDQWHQRAAVDKRNKRHAYRGGYYDYESLLQARNGGFADQLGLDLKTKRYNACQAGVDELARRYAACGANLAIILGNDQREVFKDEFTPAFLVYAGETIENVYPDEEELDYLEGQGLKVSLHGHAVPGGAVYPGAPAAANAIVDSLIEAQFDVSISTKLPKPNGKDFGIPHAYGFIFRRIMNDAPPPTVPIFSNVGETRNQPRLKRMIAFGHALKKAIDALPDDLNVAIFSSGGLSHFTIDEEFDRDVMAAMVAGDEEKLAAFPESWFWGNTCETKSWYPLVAAMNDAGRKMDIIDYVPCYRSEAGTGQAMIFASWN
jgi:hypothetical protein